MNEKQLGLQNLIDRAPMYAVFNQFRTIQQSRYEAARNTMKFHEKMQQRGLSFTSFNGKIVP